MQSWVHSRRYFVEAESFDKSAVNHALDFIGRLYKIEAHITDKKLADEKKREHLLTHSKPIVEDFFCGARSNCSDKI